MANPFEGFTLQTQTRSPFSLGFAPDPEATERSFLRDYFLRNLPLTETERIMLNPDRMVLRFNDRYALPYRPRLLNYDGTIAPSNPPAGGQTPAGGGLGAGATGATGATGAGGSTTTTGAGAGAGGSNPASQTPTPEQYKLTFGDADWNEFAKGMVADVFNNPGYSSDLRLEILRARNTGYITDATIRRYYEERAALEKQKQEREAQAAQSGASNQKQDDWFDPRMFWMLMMMRFALGNNQGGF